MAALNGPAFSRNTSVQQLQVFISPKVFGSYVSCWGIFAVQAERGGVVQPAEENAPGSSFPVPTGTFYKGMEQLDMGEWL